MFTLKENDRELAPNSNAPYDSMSDQDFRRFRNLIYEKCGINLTDAKKTMLAGRLRKRLRALDMDDFGDYFQYVSGITGRASELVHMLDAVSTNKTEFFREPKHFDYLKEVVLPGMVRSGCWLPGRRLNVWSAGCSSGEEAYTLAMVLADFATKNRTGIFSILATDISTRMLEIGAKGIYPENATAPVPAALKHRYLMQGKGTQKGYCRVVPELRSKVQFKRLNLNNGSDFGLRTRMDIIFCRNVIIYFDRDIQKRLFEKFYAQIAQGGYLFIGHSETLQGISERFKSVAVAVYH